MPRASKNEEPDVDKGVALLPPVEEVITGLSDRFNERLLNVPRSAVPNAVAFDDPDEGDEEE